VLTLDKNPPAEADGHAAGLRDTGPTAPRDSAPAASGAKAADSGERDTGAALRSVYQKTIEEAVPDEMLDLLSKLD
jgi:hypothetical protein